MPAKALLIFLILSSYHFGQEFLEDMDKSKNRPWEIMVFGITLLIAPLLICYGEVKGSIEFIMQRELPEMNFITQLLSVSIIFMCCFGQLFVLNKKGQISKSVLIQQFMKLMVIALTFVVLPFIVAFTLYFVLFHSLNAFKHQYEWLKERSKAYNKKKFLLDLSLFSALSIAGIITLLLIFRPTSAQELASYFFVIISVFTLPHSLLFDHFYKVRGIKFLQTTK